jgi:hypothetical protein
MAFGTNERGRRTLPLCYVLTPANSYNDSSTFACVKTKYYCLSPALGFTVTTSLALFSFRASDEFKHYYTWVQMAATKQTASPRANSGNKTTGESRKKRTLLIRAQSFMYLFSYYKLTKLICVRMYNGRGLMTD